MIAMVILEQLMLITAEIDAAEVYQQVQDIGTREYESRDMIKVPQPHQTREEVERLKRPRAALA